MQTADGADDVYLRPTHCFPPRCPRPSCATLLTPAGCRQPLSATRLPRHPIVLSRGRLRAVARSDRWICLWHARLDGQRLDQQTECPTLYYSYRQLNRPRRHSFRSTPTLLHTTDYQPPLVRPTGSQTNRWSHMKHSTLSTPPDNMVPARTAMHTSKPADPVSLSNVRLPGEARGAHVAY